MKASTDSCSFASLLNLLELDLLSQKTCFGSRKLTMRDKSGYRASSTKGQGASHDSVGVHMITRTTLEWFLIESTA